MLGSGVSGVHRQFDLFPVAVEGRGEELEETGETEKAALDRSGGEADSRGTRSRPSTE
jgi:hypothetical protein